MRENYDYIEVLNLVLEKMFFGLANLLLTLVKGLKGLACIVDDKWLWPLLHDDFKVPSLFVDCKNLLVEASGITVCSIMISLIFSYYKMGLSRSTLSTNFFYSSSSCFCCFLPVLQESSIQTTGSSFSTTFPAIISVGECNLGSISSLIFLHSLYLNTESSNILSIR